MLSAHADRYAEFKQSLIHTLGAQEDLLHVHAGLLLFVASALLLRQRMRSPWPLAIVIFFALLNELLDYSSTRPWNGPLSALDVVNTIIWPLLLFLLARRAKPQQNSV